MRMPFLRRALSSLRHDDAKELSLSLRKELKAQVRAKGFAYISNLVDTTTNAVLGASLLPRTEELLKKELPLGIGSAKGFHELTQRSPGRYDAPAELKLTEKAELKDVLHRVYQAAVAALGDVPCDLAFVGVVVSEPGAPAQMWHIDSLHTSKRFEPCPNMVNILIPLGEDVAPEMGPTELIPGSHKLTNHHQHNFGKEIAYQDPKNHPSMLGLKEETTIRKWSMHDALIFDDRIMHRGGANLSQQRRYVAYFSYRRSDFTAATHFEAFRSVDKFLREAPGITEVRKEFPGIRKTIIADGAGGSQVHSSVLTAVTDAMTRSANIGGHYDASKNVGAIVHHGRRAYADLFGTTEDAVVFGPNATSLNVQLGHVLFSSKAASGKNIVVSALDHDSNVGLWAWFAKKYSVEVRTAGFNGWQLDTEKMISFIDDNTIFVAVGLASNGIGTINDVKTICAAAKEKKALSFVDAVHGAPHLRPNVTEMGCDFCVASPYKFFGPHFGVLVGRPELLAELDPAKLAVSDSGLPSEKNLFMSKWETGTNQFEAIAGATAAVDYIASLGRRFGGVDATPNPELLSLRTPIPDLSLNVDAPRASYYCPVTGVTRSQLLDAAYAVIGFHEDKLKAAFLRGAKNIPKLRIFGHNDPTRDLSLRTSTFAVAIDGVAPDQLARGLVDKYDIACTAGNHYCTFWESQYGVPGATRLSFLHYNTLADVDVVLEALGAASDTAFLRDIVVQRWP